MGKLVTLVIALLLAMVVFFVYINNRPMETNTLTAANQSFAFNRRFNNIGAQSLGEVADPNYLITLPKDHASHESFDLEWWYLTSNLQDNDGNNYGLQWTLFRFRKPNISAIDDVEIQSTWNNEQLYMAHASVHSDSEHWFSEKFARGGVGNAGIEKQPLKLFADDWQWVSQTDGLLPARLMFNAKLISNNNKHRYLNVQLDLSNDGPYVLQGKNGYSIKSANGEHASHYYSAPFIKVNGTLATAESDNAIFVKGNAWFDQEWTSQLFDEATLGWDWLSLHLDNGDKIMAFRMRLEGQADYITGTYIDSKGQSTQLMSEELELIAVEEIAVGDKQLPLSWQLEIESKGIELKIKATKDDQWNPASIAYYEGSVMVEGTHKGQGFLELTGY